MILTVTLNTSIDKLYLMDSIRPETVMRVKEVHNTAGGKGLNVSRAAAKLGEPVTAMGFTGGFNGRYLESLIASPLVRCAFTHVTGETRSCINFCEAIKPGCGLPSMDTYLDEGLYEVVQTWDATIGDSTCVILKDERDMEWLKSVNPLWHKSLTNAGTRSLVLLPLKNSRATIGYLWAVNFNTENTVKIKETLELTSFFVASEISNYQLLHRLEILGSIDTLTGVQNRNKMNLMVDDVVSGRTVIQTPYAIVFADLNGLKRINDEEGHIAGDMILKKAAEVLRATFPRCDIYRAGGDEFMVLAPGMDDATLRARQKRVKEAAEAVEGLVFAVGACMVRGDEDIRAAMRFADQAMYADKKEYYADHPDQKYR